MSVISINPSKLSAGQQAKLHEEQKKLHRLQQQKTQIELNLINLQQAANTFRKLVQHIKNQPNHTDNHFMILTNGKDLIDHFEHLKKLTQTWFKLKQDQLRVCYDISALEYANLNLETQLQIQEVIQNEVKQKMTLQQQMIEQAKISIAGIEQKLRKFNSESDADLQNHVTEFITELLSLYPNSITQTEIGFIKRLDFGALNHKVLTEISNQKKVIEEMKIPIFSLRKQILDLQQQVIGKEELEQELENNKIINKKNQEELKKLVQFNDELEKNFEDEVKKDVEERKQMLNKSHFDGTNKYMMASEYLIKGFATLLGEQKYKEMIDRLNALKEEAAKKSNLQNHEAMNDEI